MEKIILISTDVVNDLEGDELENFFKIANRLIAQKNVICIISREENKLKTIQDKFEGRNIKNVQYKTRINIRDIINDNKDKAHYFIVLGNRDKDFQLAVNNKFLYLVPLWTREKFDKCMKYGVHIRDMDALYKVIETINNQNKWFYKLELDDKTKIYSLISAHTRNWNISDKEKELVQGFEDFLKKGKVSYYEILLYHFLAAIANNPEFREVTTWAIMPSSGTELNNNMLEFKERARYCMKGAIPRCISKGDSPNNVFLRTKRITKSHDMSYEDRIRYGSTRHLDSIIINDAYDNGRLKNKVVCVLDDYLTNGNSFEAVRNILKKEQVKKIIFVSLGRFKRPYFYQDYKINGDVFHPGYKYVLKHKKMIDYGCIDDNARKEVENLYDIFNLGED